VAGVSLEISNSQMGFSRQVKTDSAGSFRVDGLSTVNYRVRVTDSGADYYASPSDKDEKQLTIRIGEAEVKGHVTLPAGVGAADLAFVRPRFAAMHVEIPKSGEFRLLRVRSGSWHYALRSGSDRSVLRHGDIDVPVQGTVELRVAGGGSAVKLMVVDAESRPVSRARICVGRHGDRQSSATSMALYSGMPGMAFTQSDGTCAVSGLPEGRYWIGAQRNDAVGVADEVAVNADGGTDGPVRIQLGKGGGTAAVTILSIADGKPIADATAATFSSGGLFVKSTAFDSNGRTELACVPPVRCTVILSAPYHAQKRIPVLVETGKTIAVNGVLDLGGDFEWTITAPDGTPIENVKCRIVPDDPNSIETEHMGYTRDGGKFHVAGLHPGSYSATAQLGQKTLSARVNIKARTTTRENSGME
jgi:hypothetical protein